LVRELASEGLWRRDLLHGPPMNAKRRNGKKKKKKRDSCEKEH